MSASLATVSYIGATILFILSLGGLSNPETSRRGNLYGMIGMAIAVLATDFVPRVSMSGIPCIIAAMAVGGTVGLYAAPVSYTHLSATGIPGLSALPVVGALFGVQTSTRKKTELVMLITPRIVRSLSLPDASITRLAGGIDAYAGAAHTRFRSGACLLYTSRCV